MKVFAASHFSNCEQGEYPPGRASAAAGGSFVQAPYVTIGNSASLTQERALTEGAGINITDGGANSTVTIAADIVGSGGVTIIDNGGTLDISLDTLSARGTYQTVELHNYVLHPSNGGSGRLNCNFGWQNTAGTTSAGTYDFSTNTNSFKRTVFETNVSNYATLVSDSQIRPSSSSWSGGYYEVLFAIEAVNSDSEWAVCLSNEAIFINSFSWAGTIDNRIDCIGVGCHSTDTNMQIFFNNRYPNSSPPFDPPVFVDLGSGWPAKTAGGMYMLRITLAASATNFGYELRNFGTGATTTGTVSSSRKPTVNMCPLIYMNDGSGSPNSVCKIGLQRITIFTYR